MRVSSYPHTCYQGYYHASTTDKQGDVEYLWEYESKRTFKTLLKIRNITFQLKKSSSISSERSFKKLWCRIRDMRIRRVKSMLSRAKISYALVRWQDSFLANQVTERSCRSNSSLISLPMASIGLVCVLYAKAWVLHLLIPGLGLRNALYGDKQRSWPTPYGLCRTHQWLICLINTYIVDAFVAISFHRLKLRSLNQKDIST